VASLCRHKNNKTNRRVQYRLFLQTFHDSSKHLRSIVTWNVRGLRVTLSNRSWSIWKRWLGAFPGGNEGNYETPIRIAIYWIGFETGTSSIWLDSTKHSISRKLKRAVKEKSNRSPFTIKYLHFLRWHSANYFLLLYFYPATICNFCDNTRKLFATSVIAPGNYLQLLW
jgi:hypothetical protein